jgi:outer membrane receptor protein involved in Fe transport
MNRRHLHHRALARAISSILCATGAFAQIHAAHAQSTAAPAAEEVAPAADAGVPGGVVTDEVVVTADPLRALGSGPSDSSLGFSKSLYETPRSVSFISEQQITLFGISTVEDLTRLVPSTYTTTRYGLQGGVNVRGVPSDMYYRGMKRLQMQGHVRTVLSAMDGIEVIKGPPSPIFGMGRIGGYENFTPKSSRASTGTYTSELQGFVQTTQGSYNRNEMQGGLGGPLNRGDKQGGYYLFGLYENSDTWVKQVGAKQKFFQGTVSLDEVIGGFRMEFGGQLQTSITSGAYMNRVNQDMLDHGTYLSGQPMANLDLNGDGMIGVVEAAAASPVRGTLSSNNQPLNQRYNIPKDPVTGALLNVNAFPTVAGIPATMKAYLNAHPEINCQAAQVMRTMPTGGPVPASGQLPVGFMLNPCTVATVPVDYRGNGSFEREQNADQKLAYIDLINDSNPNFTLKNQIIYDNIDSFKDSYLPYGENQYIKAMEDKFTVTRRINQEVLPNWLAVNMLASLNYRKTWGWIKSSGGDFDWRQDIMYNDGLHYPNTKFWTQLTNADYATGALDTQWRSSEYDDKGLGVMFDIDIFHTNIVVGGRYDKSKARATDMPTYNANAGVSPAPGVVCLAPGPGCPGAMLGVVNEATNEDSGGSWSISVSQQIGERWRPYATAANSSLQLATSNDQMTISVVRGGKLIGEAELQEVGVKGQFLNDKFQWSSAGYRQTRIDISDPDDPSDSSDVSSTESTGVETEVRWVPSRSVYFSAYVLNQYSHYIVPSSNSISLNARQMGFQDVKDPVTGAVLYPAEAFFYGGKANVSVPSGAAGEPYMERTGNPETQAGANFNYTFKNGVGLIFGANWFSEVWADRGKTTLIPEATVFNLGASWDMNSWRLRLNGYNVTDERYFRAGGGNAGIMSSMPGARWEITAKKEFD